MDMARMQTAHGHNFGAQALNTQFSRDLTNADLSSHMGPVTASGGLLVNFAYVKVRCESSNAAQNGQIQTRLCVIKQPKGDRRTVSVRYTTPEQAKRDFPREFELFERYEEVPSEGTPLAELPGISMSQIGQLVINGLRSIEDLAELSDDAAAQIGLDATKAQKVARAWLAKSRGEHETIAGAEAAAKMEAEHKALMDRLTKLEESNRALEAQNRALMNLGGNQQGAQAQPTRSNGQVPYQAGQQGGAAPAEIEDDGLPYKVEDMPPMFEGSGEVATGNDDLGGSDIDPLAGS